MDANEFENRNVSFIGGRGFWIFYIALLLGVRFMLFLTPGFEDLHCGWSLVHLCHCALTFLLFHWKKGSPLFEDQGVYDRETFWEQIDCGEQFTNNRKFLTIVPVVVFLLATHESAGNLDLFLPNAIALAIILIAKSPAMHKVRILGINKD